MNRIRRLTGLALSLVLAAALLGGMATSQAEERFRLTILHNNDGESYLLNAGPGLEDFGGVARFKAVADRLKQEATIAPNSAVLMLSSGDNFQAGAAFQASLDRGVPFLDAVAMMLIGYDASAIGNHEFDLGPDVFAGFLCSLFLKGPGEPIAACNGLSGRIGFPFVSSNLDVSGEPRLMELAKTEAIARSVVIRRGEHEIGIVGATTPELPYIASPRNVRVTADVARAVQAEVDALEARGINKIILIGHLQDINQDIALAKLLRGVDVIVAGGGGELLANHGDLLVPGDRADPSLPYPLLVKNAAGIETPIVGTPGAYRYVGRLVIDFDSAGNVVSIGSESGPVRVAGAEFVDGVKPDGIMVNAVERPAREYLEGLREQLVGRSEVDLDNSFPSARKSETNLGNLMADAILWQAKELAESFGATPPDVALINSGAIRLQGVLPPGPVTRLATYDIAPFVSFVSVVANITPEQFKLLMENSVSQVEVNHGRFGQIAGFRVTWDPNGTPQSVDEAGHLREAGSRVVSIQLEDGRYIVEEGLVVPGAPSVNFATLDFLARGGDQYRFPGAFWNLGVTYQQALEAFIQGVLEGVITAAEYPAAGEGRIASTN